MGYYANPTLHTCDLTLELIIDLDLYDELRLDTVSGFLVGSDNVLKYPDFDSADPTPAKDRGYYFAGTSYLKKLNDVKMSP